MNVHDWISLQRTILYEVAETQVKALQHTLSRKGQSRMTEKGTSLHAEELRVRVRHHTDRYVIIEWLIRRWTRVDGRSRFTTRTLRKGRGYQVSSAILARHARAQDLPTVLEAEAVFADCRRRLARLNALERELIDLGYDKS